MDELIVNVTNGVLAKLDYSREVSDEEISEMIASQTRMETTCTLLSLRERELLEQSVFNALRRFDIIQELLDDEDVTEIMINGPKHIFYEKKGELFPWPKTFPSEEKLQDLIQRIVGEHNRVVNTSCPIVDTRLPDGSRVCIALAPVSIDGSAVTIRKFPKYVMTMRELQRLGSITEEAAVFLLQAVRKGYSILVSGGTGTGKTTFLNALSEAIPSDERVITIEDSAELQLQGIVNLVRLETRNANQAAVSEITIRSLIKTALRMRPSRLIVGEVRGAECFDLLQALNTGHEGSLTSAHANSCEDVLMRLEMMVRMGIDLPLDAIRAQIASGIDLIVQLGRMKDRSRKVIEIAEITRDEAGEIHLNPLYVRKGTRELVRIGELQDKEKLER